MAAGPFEVMAGRAGSAPATRCHATERRTTGAWQRQGVAVRSGSWAWCQCEGQSDFVRRASRAAGGSTPEPAGLTRTLALEKSALGTADNPRGTVPRRWERLLTVQGRFLVRTEATRWPPAMDPPARALAAGTLRRLGTPAWLRARVAHSQNG